MQLMQKTLAAASCKNEEGTNDAGIFCQWREHGRCGGARRDVRALPQVLSLFGMKEGMSNRCQ